MSGQPDPSTFNIILRGEATAKTFFIAQGGNGEYLHDVVGSGRDLREVWDFRLPSDGMGEVVRHAPNSNGEHYTINIDTTTRGLRLSPSVNQTNNTSITLTGVPGGPSAVSNSRAHASYAEDSSSATTRYTYIDIPISTTVIRTFKINNSTNALVNTFDHTYTAHANNDHKAGRWERFAGGTYRCAYTPGTADVNSLELLVVNGGGGEVDTYTAINAAVSVPMLLRRDAGVGAGTTTGALSQLLRGLTSNQLQSVDSSQNPLSNVQWAPAPGHEVGDSTAFITGGASYAGYTFIAKTDGLYAFDSDGNSYSVISFVTRTNASEHNGYGTTAYGDRCFYPCENGLWRIIDITRAALIGPDAIPGYTSTPQTAKTTATMPIRQRHYEVTYFGKWIYALYCEPTGGVSYVLAGTIDRHPHTGFEMKWYTLISRDTEMLRGITVDSRRQLRFVDQTNGREHFFQLALDGSPDSTADGRGGPSETSDWVGPQVDFGEPETLKQLRWAFIEAEGGVSTCDWQLRQYLDGGAGAQIGSSFDGTTTPQNINWTVGTTDTCYKAQFGFRAVTEAGYDETAGDPKILSLIVHARTPDTIRVVLTPKGYRNLFDVAKLLRKQKDAGPVTIREPDTNETFTGYIKQVNNVTYTTSSGTARGLEVLYQRFTVAA